MACEKGEGKKTGWQRLGWHILITLSFPVYLMNISMAPKNKEITGYALVCLFLFLIGYFLISFIISDSLTLIMALLVTFCFFGLWFLVAYIVGGIIQGIRNGTLFTN
ncbi:MAG: hypothetical protein AB1333_02900 [Patescibacteria group bacterium]